MKNLLFNTHEYQYLADKLKENKHFEKGEVERSIFSDGEVYQRIITPVEDRNVYILGGTSTDQATLELYDLAYSVAVYGANSLNLIVPYYGYSTMERAVKEREIATAKTRARLFSSIPRSNKGNKIYLFDLHSEGVTYYFNAPLFPNHIYCKSIILKIARKYGGENYVIASTDAGRAKWVESLANEVGVSAAFILKRRVGDGKTEVSAVNADVKNKNVIIYDDMIRSGSSIVNAAKTYKQAGANKIFVITTHGIFVKDSIKKMKEAGCIEKVVSLDTHPNVLNSIEEVPKNSKFLEICSISSIIKEVLKK